MSRVFVSDVHLDASAPDAAEQFFAFLDTYAANAEALYILGDLFEVWVGDDDPDPEKRRVVSALRKLTDRGVACFVIHGNRDFLLGRQFCDDAGVRLLPDPIVIELDGERVLVTHGDALCTDDHAYQELRSSVRTADWQKKFLALPFSVRDSFANQARKGSKAQPARFSHPLSRCAASAISAVGPANEIRTQSSPWIGSKSRPGVVATPASSSMRRQNSRLSRVRSETST